MRSLPGDALLAAVEPALPRQRWFPVKGRPVTFRLLGQVPLPAAGPVQTAHLLVGVDPAGPGASSAEPLVLQVPVTVREEPLPGAPVLGVADGLTVHDGPHDPAWVAALLTCFATDTPGPVTAGTGHPRRAVHRSGHVLGPLPEVGCSSRVPAGEQSNTSVILAADSPQPAMLKLFRVLTPGDNPDVEVTAALTGARSPDVPAVLGWLEGRWCGAPAAGEHRGHLAVLTRFVTDGRDAWAAAVEAAGRGRPFTAEAERIGAATARVHATLAEAFGVTACLPPLRDALVAGLQQRVDWALDRAPVLAGLTAPLLAHRERLDRLSTEDLGPLQRVHGDLHLGQVLLTGGDGVAILDFEGEPLRPLAQRTLPDLPLRDVVGMLRSFDYAAATAGADGPGWSRSCARAFLAGAGVDADTAAAQALWLDKALYEVVYETGNRPDRVQIPLRAVRSAFG